MVVLRGLVFKHLLVNSQHDVVHAIQDRPHRKNKIELTPKSYHNELPTIIKRRSNSLSHILVKSKDLIAIGRPINSISRQATILLKIQHLRRI